MKRTLEILIIGLVAGGLMTGCPKKEEETKTEEPVEEETKEEETKEEETPEAEPDAAEEKVEVNEENYLKAIFEVSCVRAKVEDTEKQKEIIAEVYPRYGFTEESFNTAQEAMKDNETIKVSLEKKMTDECTEEFAAGLGKDGAAEEKVEEKVEDGKKPAAKKKWAEGSYNDPSVTGGGLEGASLRLNVTKEGKMMGTFKGKREGKGFIIPVNGEIGSDGTFNISGKKGPNMGRFTGRFNNGQLQGSIKGSINKKGLSVNFSAKK